MSTQEKRRWCPSNVEVPDRVIDAMDAAMVGRYADRNASQRHETLRIGLQAALQEWAGDRPAWSMNVPAEQHVVWLENRVKELEHGHYKAQKLVEDLREVLS